MRASNIALSGAILRDKAKKIAAIYGIENFEGSSGWLWRFQQRHNMVGLQMCGESAKVDENSVNLRLSNFITVKNSYAPRDVFNMDESGIFYNLMTNRTLHIKGERCHGGAKSKQRVTVVLCCNSDGSEKYKAWVIGKSRNPRCFKNVDKSHLPCNYTHHVSSWIDAQAFREWLLKLDQKLIAQHRHILLTLDNCAAHDARHTQY
nr:tigger transposable element-derived protein 6-like [Onthophagus taurus]